jgi:cell cycle arrest protein BUB2
MNSNLPQMQLPQFTDTLSPRSVRTLRRFQSHQNLSSSPTLSSLAAQSQLHVPAHSSSNPSSQPDSSVKANNSQNNAESAASQPHGRTRSNSDVTQSILGTVKAPRKPTANRKAGSMGVIGKRSGLDLLLRDGPPGDNIATGLDELRYLILSTRVDADNDGMVFTFLPGAGFPPLANLMPVQTVSAPHIRVACSP